MCRRCAEDALMIGGPCWFLVPWPLLLLMHAVQVVALQQSEWRRLKTQQQRVEYAWQLSQGVEVSAPGMSHLVHQVEVGKPEPGRPSLPQTLWRILLEGH